MNLTAPCLISFLLISLLGCAPTSPPGSIIYQPASGKSLKKACLSAAIKGIKTEIARYQGWIDLRRQAKDVSQDLPALEEGLSSLKADLEKYQSLDSKDYQLPVEIKLMAWVEVEPGENGILHMEGMTRSGPWYHLAGIKGDDYGVLKPGTKYLMSIYKVYPRSYFNMESSYVYIAKYQEQ